MIMILCMLQAIPFPSSTAFSLYHFWTDIVIIINSNLHPRVSKTLGPPKSNMLVYFGETWGNHLDAVSVAFTRLISSKIHCRSPLLFFKQSIDSRALLSFFTEKNWKGPLLCSQSCPQAAAKLQRLVPMSLQQWWKALGPQWLGVIRGTPQMAIAGKMDIE